MKFGIHYGYWLHTWENADLKYYCRKAANLGFDLLELSGHAILSASEAELRELRELADGLGVGVNACHGLSRENSTSSADSAARARGIDELKRLYDRVEPIGSRQLGSTPTGPRSTPATRSWICAESGTAAWRASPSPPMRPRDAASRSCSRW